MQIILEQIFLKSAEKLPENIKKKLVKMVTFLEINPFHPLLHTKRLQGDLTGFLSFRITRDWRVVFYFKNPDTLQLVKTAHRKDIYR